MLYLILNLSYQYFSTDYFAVSDLEGSGSDFGNLATQTKVFVQNKLSAQGRKFGAFPTWSPARRGPKPQLSEMQLVQAVWLWFSVVFCGSLVLGAARGMRLPTIVISSVGQAR